MPTLLELLAPEPWYAKVFFFGALVGGWWYLCDTVYGWFRRKP